METGQAKTNPGSDFSNCRGKAIVIRGRGVKGRLPPTTFCMETRWRAQPLYDSVAVKFLVVQARETEAQEVASGGGGAGGRAEPLGLGPDQPPGAGTLLPPARASSPSCSPPGVASGNSAPERPQVPTSPSETETIAAHRLLRVRPHSQRLGPEDLRWCFKGSSCPFPQAHFQQEGSNPPCPPHS